MFCQATLDPWHATIMTHLPHLSKTQAAGLALWSLGMVLARSCALTAVSAFLAEGLKQKENTVRQRLREWLRMLRQLKPAVPKGWTVIVLADRGLYARGLFGRIVRLGWHPFLRINTGGTFRPEGSPLYRPLGSFVPEVDTAWRGRGTAFNGRGHQRECTLLARWEAGYKDPWLILTDLPPEASDACWYGLRSWIEQGFKVVKRAGWQWQRTRMSDPGRATRLWLAVSVATLWLLSVGGTAEDSRRARCWM